MDELQNHICWQKEQLAVMAAREVKLLKNMANHKFAFLNHGKIR